MRRGTGPLKEDHPAAAPCNFASALLLALEAFTLGGASVARFNTVLLDFDRDPLIAEGVGFEAGTTEADLDKELLMLEADVATA